VAGCYSVFAEGRRRPEIVCAIGAGGWGVRPSIDLNPAVFPHAYELNAIAKMNLEKLDAAEESATAGD